MVVKGEGVVLMVPCERRREKKKREGEGVVFP
jgi:hypothetical protein